MTPKKVWLVANKLIYRDGVKYIVTMGAGLIIATNSLIVENKVLQLILRLWWKKDDKPWVPPIPSRSLWKPDQLLHIFLPWIAPELQPEDHRPHFKR